MNFQRIPCAFHQNQFITNFCTCTQCLLPLCPLCIKIHTNQHIEMKIDPEYEHINSLIEEIEIDMDSYLGTYNSNYKNIVQLDAKIEQFRNNLKSKIDSLKLDIIAQVEAYFRNLQDSTDKQVQNMSYIQALGEYKDHAKKSILYMKAIQRGLNDPNKVMRTIIKYKAQRIKTHIETFQNQIQLFASQLDKSFISFSLREDYKQSLQANLQAMKKIQIKDIVEIMKPIDLSSKLKDVIHRQNQKKQIKQSIANMFQKSSVNDASKNRDNHNNMQISRNSSIDGRRRSLSKGKGLTVLMSMSNVNSINNVLNTTFDSIKIPKPTKLLNHQQNFENMPRMRITTTAARKINRM